MTDSRPPDPGRVDDGGSARDAFESFCELVVPPLLRLAAVMVLSAAAAVLIGYPITVVLGWLGVPWLLAALIGTSTSTWIVFRVVR